MLADNGKKTKQKRNLHILLEEFTILLDHVRTKYSMRWFLMLIIQFSMGMRCSEMLAINLADFSSHFSKLDYRQAKTNKMIYDEPVPPAVQQLIIAFLIRNAHTCIDGYFFPRHVGKGHVTTETYNAAWCKWRQEIGKKHDSFLDLYEGKNGPRYRISSHCLRRLHRTLLADNHPDKLFLLSKLCHYEKFEKFEAYINQYKMMKQRMEIIMPVINPVVHQIMSLPREQIKLTRY